MPAVIELELRHDAGLEVYPARIHGAACAILEADGGDHAAQVKPFSATPPVATSTGSLWTVGWLSAVAPPTTPTTVRFGNCTAVVVGHRCNEYAYEVLAGSKPARSAEFEFWSPTYFSRNGRDYPLPDPVLIVRSLASRWNAWASDSVRIDEADLRDLCSAVVVPAFEGRTVRARVTYTMDQTGFVGQVRLALGRSASDRAQRVLAALAKFAPIAGVGAQPTHGFGACRLLAVHTERERPIVARTEVRENRQTA